MTYTYYTDCYDVLVKWRKVTISQVELIWSFYYHDSSEFIQQILKANVLKPI